jgi:hypothetical protein
MLMPVHILPVPIKKHTGKTTPESTVYKYSCFLYTVICTKCATERGGKCEK